jgi:hypothetical protein
MRRPHVPASRDSDAQSARVAQARLADRQAACGHARYTKGCDLCALAGIYHDHMSRPDLTTAEQSKVIRLYLAGDKAALFKLWYALPAADDS